VKTDKNTDENFLTAMKFDFFQIQLKSAFRLRPMFVLKEDTPMLFWKKTRLSNEFAANSVIKIVN